MQFNLLDLGLLGLAMVAAFGGWRLGLITRALSWAGMGVGVAVAARIIPSVIDSARESSSSGELALIAVAILVAAAFVGQAVGLVLGNRLNLSVRSVPARRIDSMGGALAGVLGVLVAIWLIVPTAADITGWPSRTVRRSQVARVVTDVLPRAPDATRTLRSLLGNRYPQVFDTIRPTAPTGPPPRATGVSVPISDRVVRSTVKVVGEACNQIQEGSGFVAASGMVVTNAHVVAGEGTTILERSDGSRVAANVVAFDPDRDLAVLAAPGIDRPALPLGQTDVGAVGGVYGHPGGGPLTISPFRVSERVTAVGSDIYNERRTRRNILILASSLAPGDSGSALVDPQGAVVGVAFAIAPDRPGVAYALSIAELRPVLRSASAASSVSPVDTGPCVA